MSPPRSVSTWRNASMSSSINAGNKPRSSQAGLFSSYPCFDETTDDRSSSSNAPFLERAVSRFPSPVTRSSSRSSSSRSSSESESSESSDADSGSAVLLGTRRAGGRHLACTTARRNSRSRSDRGSSATSMPCSSATVAGVAPRAEETRTVSAPYRKTHPSLVSRAAIEKYVRPAPTTSTETVRAASPEVEPPREVDTSSSPLSTKPKYASSCCVTSPFSVSSRD